MLSGLNVDIECEGKIFHVQTEDGGHNNPVITSHIFVGGAIVSSKKISYADSVLDGISSEGIRQLMKEQHETMITSVARASGRTSELGADSRSAKGLTSPSRIPMPKGRRTLDEVIEEYLSTSPETPP